MMSDKIKPHHLGRMAILYVRQSSAHQVMHNQESRILQYAMRDRLHDLGWRALPNVLARSLVGRVPPTNDKVLDNADVPLRCVPAISSADRILESRRIWEVNAKFWDCARNHE
jgi:hypothetical protein